MIKKSRNQAAFKILFHLRSYSINFKMFSTHDLSGLFKNFLKEKLNKSEIDFNDFSSVNEKNVCDFFLNVTEK